MNKYKVILFDLDGTLSDPKEGITKSVQYALEYMNIVEEDLHKLDSFIGPPLQESFKEYYGFDERQTNKAIERYRERFKKVGMFENDLYPNIDKLLRELVKQGFILVVATSKPTVFAKQIVEYFNIKQHFDLIVGSQLDGTRTSKSEIIQYIMNRYEKQRLRDFVMIGDRKHDMIGAKFCGIDSIAVTYGYGSYNELATEEPTFMVDSVFELKELLLGT
ncbi:HAD family hydrolase [Alkalihalobacillus trypoxylicola]|uniref:Phosphoglycolate phosphatase n=1 Tax=Alkalihalobacillus trypoxylicola TaxID=519424 RepID=A0A161QJ98_9BACI|nr:HAD family hydrolase [Alkalihalobacillus trypoxylicola]KYG29648.1 phosphoglycolate phosphatase [Alkalihalobacillus trypoxylicola]